MWLRSLEVLKQQETLNNVKEDAGVNFRRHKAQTKVKPIYSEVEMYERISRS